MESYVYDDAFFYDESYLPRELDQSLECPEVEWTTSLLDSTVHYGNAKSPGRTQQVQEISAEQATSVKPTDTPSLLDILMLDLEPPTTAQTGSPDPWEPEPTESEPWEPQPAATELSEPDPWEPEPSDQEPWEPESVASEPVKPEITIPESLADQESDTEEQHHVVCHVCDSLPLQKAVSKSLIDRNFLRKCPICLGIVITCEKHKRYATPHVLCKNQSPHHKTRLLAAKINRYY